MKFHQIFIGKRKGFSTLPFWMIFSEISEKYFQNMNSSEKEFEIGKVHKIWKTARNSENTKILKIGKVRKPLRFPMKI